MRIHSDFFREILGKKIPQASGQADRTKSRDSVLELNGQRESGLIHVVKKLCMVVTSLWMGRSISWFFPVMYV